MTGPPRAGRMTAAVSVTAAAVAAGLFWPLTVPVYAVGRGVVAAVTARPRRSSYERRLDSRQVQERIRELEEGLGMPDDDPAHRGQPGAPR